jgi:hypothetical protein
VSTFDRPAINSCDFLGYYSACCIYRPTFRKTGWFHVLGFSNVWMWRDFASPERRVNRDLKPLPPLLRGPNDQFRPSGLLPGVMCIQADVSEHLPVSRPAPPPPPQRPNATRHRLSTEVGQSRPSEEIQNMRPTGMPKRRPVNNSLDNNAKNRN